MSRTVYSTQLASGVAAAGVDTVFTVRAGTAVVVRDSQLFMPAGDEDDINWGVEVAGTQVQLGTNYGVSGPVWLPWDGRVVLNADDSIFTEASVGGWTFVVSGYILSLP